jgi:uncharacterized membrane protein (UPF0127 family)
MDNRRRRFRVETDDTGVYIGDLMMAATAWQRTIGLLGRESLGVGDGVVLSPCFQIHTWFMHFAIDVIFLDGQSRVLRIVQDMRPFKSACGGLAARTVLELPAGTARRLGLKVGQVVRMVPS